MIHPNTELRFVNNEIGYGVFATAPIPKGTIVYIKDQLEIEVTRHKFAKLDKFHQDIVEKYSYIDERGVRIISWDHAKYVNHKCECNSMSTGYGFEIAIRDIAAEEEITDEYGFFNIPTPLFINCGCTNCRKQILPNDLDTYAHVWDGHVKGALDQVPEVSQPLWDIMDLETRTSLMEYLSGQSKYRSVSNLKYVPRRGMDAKQKLPAFSIRFKPHNYF